ncbi:hypothetical protein QR680_014644 [Steinernema hermaphroditum]|uniref:Fungal lipase-type domain-containing protein n=1 Tax=Steinernema hermaphroditum TaxID=289476 RepID=A0AA39M4F7_9BILA|nr:hypothetical protein QR680_014644 [Steinernema hermaphroditum]
MEYPPGWSVAIITSLLCVLACSESVFPDEYTDEFGRGPVFDAAAVGYGLCAKRCLRRSFEDPITNFPYKNVCDANGNTCQGSVMTAVYKNQTVILVAFGGSSDSQLKTEIANLSSATPWPYGNGSVGFYFYQAFENIVLAKESIGEALNDTIKKNPTSEILITGHSLGGALASLTARHLIFTGINAERIFLVTLAEPRIGDKLFSEDFNAAVKRSARVTTQYDPVPSVPWHGFGGVNYTAHGHRIYYPYGSVSQKIFYDCDRVICPNETITNTVSACYDLKYHLRYYVPRIDLFGRHHCDHRTPMPTLNVNCTALLPSLSDYQLPYELPELKDENPNAHLHNPDNGNTKPKFAHP